MMLNVMACNLMNDVHPPSSTLIGVLLNPSSLGWVALLGALTTCSMVKE